MHPPTVLLVPGSVRRDGAHRLLASALSPVLVDAGATPELIDLRDHPMPIYDGDLEDAEGVPEQAQAVGERVRAADGMILLTPEYNGGPTALLKNAIDWLSRIDRSIFAHLLVGLAATSPSRRGGVHGLGVMRSMLIHMSVPVFDGQLATPRSYEAFEVSEPAVGFANDDDREAAIDFVHDYLAALVAHRAAG